MRIRTALAVTALTAGAVLGASGTALADDDQGWRAGFAYENVGGPAGITGAAGHGESSDDNGWMAGFTYENVGGMAGITKATGHGAGHHED
ncbi:hypothetical protein [Streptomyces sp. NPDC051218]|uniref:hypothetical protein n=1 Tax=Streptomyces sp. NPDC051218 TaxID=3365645 RepID=UPI0037A02AF3